jgi:hypothetical protein
VEETLCGGIIPAISSAAHAQNKTVRLKSLAVKGGGILTASVMVNNEPGGRTPIPESHLQGIIDQFSRHAIG